LTLTSVSSDAEAMGRVTKTEQLQIRVSKEQKAALQRAASRAGLDVSAYVLARVSSPAAEDFARLTRAAGQGESSYALAELNALLTRLTAPELQEAIAGGIPAGLTPHLANTLAAMVEVACAKGQLPVPAWAREIAPLSEPVFGSALQSLRLYLLTRSPAPFRRRNIFVDATLGDQV
jgi:uncharacterized protein (DUF1778 family)